MTYIQQDNSVTSPVTPLAGGLSYALDYQDDYCVSAVSAEGGSSIYRLFTIYTGENSVYRTHNEPVYVSMAAAPDQFDPLAGFQDFVTANWDTEGAVPITRQALAVARQILSELPLGHRGVEAAPGADGSVCMEWVWQPGNRKMYVDVGPMTRVSTYARFSDGDRVEALFPEYDSTVQDHIVDLLKRLESARPIA